MIHNIKWSKGWNVKNWQSSDICIILVPLHKIGSKRFAWKSVNLIMMDQQFYRHWGEGAMNAQLSKIRSICSSIIWSWMSFVTKENGDQKLRSAEWAGLVLCCHFVLASLHRLRHMLLPPPIMPSCDISITQSPDDHTRVIYEDYKLGATTKTADWWLISTV